MMADRKERNELWEDVARKMKQEQGDNELWERKENYSELVEENNNTLQTRPYTAATLAKSSYKMSLMFEYYQG